MAKSNAAFDHVSYIPFDRINNLTLVFMKNVKEEVRLLLLQKLGNYSSTKNGKKLISLGIILRVFLEQYKARKLVKFCLFQKAFGNWLEVKGEIEQEKKN